MHTQILESTGTANAPTSAGLTFGSFRGTDDFEQMAVVIGGCRVADQSDWCPTATDLATFHAMQPTWDPTQDTVIVEIEGQVVGFGQLFSVSDSDSARIYWHCGYVLPPCLRQPGDTDRGHAG